MNRTTQEVTGPMTAYVAPSEADRLYSLSLDADEELNRAIARGASRACIDLLTDEKAHAIEAWLAARGKK